MRKLLIPLAAAAAVAGSALPASAQYYWGGGPSISFGIHSGPSYRYYDPGRAITTGIVTITGTTPMGAVTVAL